MSSVSVRTIVMNKLQAITTWPVYDMSDSSIANLPSNKDQPWIGIQFVGGTERVDSIGPGNCWLEQGVYFIHIVTPTGNKALNPLAEAEQIRTAFRGYREGGFWVESVDPPTDQAGAAIQIDGPWHGWSVAMDYNYHFFQA